jgi:hypothetical protein
MKLLQGVRRAMFSEPSLAHPVEVGGVHPTWHPHPGDYADRDQQDGEADDKQHGCRRNQVGVLAILTRGKVTVCALVNKASAT